MRSVRLIFLAATLCLVCPLTGFGQGKDFESVIAKARQGDAEAQKEAGYLYHEGIGVRRNRRKAVHWYGKSAEQAYPLGACNLGLSYGLGDGVEKNLTLAMKWLFIATALSAGQCHFGDYVPVLVKPTQRHVNIGHMLAVEWLRARPHLKDGFGEQPWMGPAYDKPPQLQRKAKSNNGMYPTADTSALMLR
jgi:TPR repeat protein